MKNCLNQKRKHFIIRMMTPVAILFSAKAECATVYFNKKPKY